MSQPEIKTPKIVFVGIEPGDFISAASVSLVCGCVIGPASVKGLKGPVPGYRVRLYDGREDWISEDEAVMCSPGKARWTKAAELFAEAVRRGGVESDEEIYV